MTANTLRDKYFQFFQERGHARIRDSSLIPENDPTVLFTTAGMHPLVPYILGEEHPSGQRLVNVQRCIRTGDIDSVGDETHFTFFEMLGNWSLGSYFKEEAIPMSWEFLTGEQWLNIDPCRISVTVFAGDSLTPRDTESAAIWQSVGVLPERISFLGRKDNWWGPAGRTGPCGPDTEMFIDTIAADTQNNTSDANNSKRVEVWNDVFMQYMKLEDGTFQPIDRRCVDTGMGVDRMAAVLQGKQSAYDTELFLPIIRALETLLDVRYKNSAETDTSIRIIADHVRTSVFILGDEAQIVPSNLMQGYVLRRLIRRAMRHARLLGSTKSFLPDLASVVTSMYQGVYDRLVDKQSVIIDEIYKEEQQFSRTLTKGEKEFYRLMEGRDTHISGKDAFHLYDTYGFPLEITEELAQEHGMSVDRAGFNTEFEKHREKSRMDDRQTFKGGLADHSEKTTALHTATHLLHQALRDVLGTHVQQKGSNITAERLRFDFSHEEKMSAAQLASVENIVNEKIQANLPVSMEVMPFENAKQAGALAFFADKYDEMVKVYSIGNYSKEVCGGPHVEHTGELGAFSIAKEQSSSRGVRRIKAVLT